MPRCGCSALCGVNTFKKMFSKLWSFLKTHIYLMSKTSQTDPVLWSFEKCSKHPSIINIKHRISKLNSAFSLKFETKDKFSKLIQNLYGKKATQQYETAIKILKIKMRFAHIYCTTTSIVLYLIMTFLTL